MHSCWEIFVFFCIAVKAAFFSLTFNIQRWVYNLSNEVIRQTTLAMFDASHYNNYYWIKTILSREHRGQQKSVLLFPKYATIIKHMHKLLVVENDVARATAVKHIKKCTVNNFITLSILFITEFSFLFLQSSNKCNLFN